MSASPSINDPRHVLIAKIAQNLYERAVGMSLSGVNPPNINDSDFILWKKAVYASARIADAS